MGPRQASSIIFLKPATPQSGVVCPSLGLSLPSMYAVSFGAHRFVPRDQTEAITVVGGWNVPSGLARGPPPPTAPVEVGPAWALWAEKGGEGGLLPSEGRSANLFRCSSAQVVFHASVPQLYLCPRAVAGTGTAKARAVSSLPLESSGHHCLDKSYLALGLQRGSALASARVHDEGKLPGS